MPYEMGAEVVSGLSDGSTVTGVKRLYGIILTAGVDNASATLSWTDAAGTNKVIKVGALAATTAPNPVSSFESIGGATITVATTGTSPTLELVVAK